MIFVTVGTQLPFDRLIEALDKHFENSDVDIFAQIGNSSFRPSHINYENFVSPGVADDLFKKSSLIIAHAGMGSILTALKYRKPILIIPRKASLGEHRNEHQTATANWVKSLNGVTVAEDEKELVKILSSNTIADNNQNIPQYADEQLLNFLYDQINS